jgi:hypothetical protein
MTIGLLKRWYVVCGLQLPTEYMELIIYKVVIAWVADTAQQILISHTGMCSAALGIWSEAERRAVYTQLITDLTNPLKLLTIPMCAPLHVGFKMLNL